jgi:hypothetical protein
VELFPSSRFIHVVRDPRATVASLLSVGQRAREKGEKPAPFAADTQGAIHHVKRCLDSGFRASRATPDKVLTIIYEELVREPEAQAREVCKFLGVDWDADMLRPGEKKHLGEAAITVNSKEVWYDNKTYYSNPNTSSLDKWRTMLSASQQIAVCRTFQGQEDLRSLGYHISVEDMSQISLLSGSIACSFERLRSGVGRRIRRLVGATI